MQGDEFCNASAAARRIVLSECAISALFAYTVRSCDAKRIQIEALAVDDASGVNIPVVNHVPHSTLRRVSV